MALESKLRDVLEDVWHGARVVGLVEDEDDRDEYIDDAMKDLDRALTDHGMVMKLYVWEGVWTDYTPGIAFAIAASKEQAIALILANVGTGPGAESDLWSTEPKVFAVDSPYGNGVSDKYKHEVAMLSVAERLGYMEEVVLEETI